MKTSFLAIIFIFICISLIKVFENPLNEIFTMTKLNKQFENEHDGVMVIAHRGCWRLAPENSIESLEKCVELGIDMVEIDVRKTKDGHLILMHDKTVDRTTNGSGLVANLTLKEIKKLRLKEFDGEISTLLTTMSVPTLDEALSVVKDRMMVNLDAKGNIREQAYSQAKKLKILDQILIKDVISEPTESLLTSNYYQGSNFMPIIKEKYGSLEETISKFEKEPQQAYEIIFETKLGIKYACKAALAQGARCWVNTLWERLSPGYSDERNVKDPENHWGVLIKEFGVNMIQTDRPSLLIQYLKDQGLRES